MTDINLALRKNYYSLLNGTIPFGSGTVPFYDQVPSDTTFPYINASSFIAIENQSAKDTFGWTVTVSINVVMKYAANSGGQSDIDTISSQVLNIIRGSSESDVNVSAAPFNIISTAVLGTQNYVEEVPDGIIYYRNIKFQHTIFENGY